MQKTGENPRFLKQSKQKTACFSEEIKRLSINEAQYAAALKNIPDPPALLYYMGDLSAFNCAFNLAVVGSRKMSPYGKMAAEFIISGFKGIDACIISGLAYGTDACAHECALSQGFKTIAVLGSGIDHESLYPRAHRKLAERIVSGGGLVISEFPPGTPARRENFPQRNRIIAGLCRACAVIEADRKSGALITARQAFSYDRCVFAVPGNINNKLSEGANSLIHKEKARILRSAEDIINNFDDLQALAAKRSKNAENRVPAEALTPEQQKISSAIFQNHSGKGISFDEILAQTNLAPEILNAGLSMLVLSGAISLLENNFYAPNLGRNLTKSESGR